MDYVAKSDASVVILHALTGEVEMTVARFLPPEVRRVLIVHSVTVATYQAAMSIRDWVDAAVGVSPRIANYLMKRCGYDPTRTFAIPNAADLSDFSVKTDKVHKGPLRVLSLGRVEHASKGVLWIPDILRMAMDAGAEISITFAGSGPDLEKLKRACSRADIDRHVRFVGEVQRSSVPNLMATHDVLLFPSIYEGFGITLIEAMAAGCVPVASRVHGVTDEIITDQRNGLIFGVANTREAARCLVRLHHDRAFLNELSAAAQTRALDFGLDHFGARYLQLLKTVQKLPHPVRAPLPMSEWSLPRELGPGLRRFLPLPVKNLLRITRERLAAHT